MEKQLIEEIDRMKEIMGISLIVESSGPIKNFLTSLMSEYWSQSDNALKNLMTDSLEKAGKTFDEASDIFDEIVSGAKTIDDFPDVNFSKIVDDILSSSNGKQYKDMLYDVISDKIDQSVGSTLKSVDNTISSIDFEDLKVKNPKGYNDIISKLEEGRKLIDDTFKDDPELAAIIRAKAGLDDIPELSNSNKLSELVKPVNKSMKDWIYELTQDQEWLEQVGIWYSEIARWYDTWKRDIQNLLSGSFLKEKLPGIAIDESTWGNKSILEKIQSLSDEITNLMKKDLSEGTPETNERLIARVTELIYALKESSNTAPQDILNQLKSKGNISPELYDELIKDNSKFMEWWGAVTSEYTKKGKVTTSIGTGMADEFKALWQMNPLTFIFKGVGAAQDAAKAGAKGTVILSKGLSAAWDQLTITAKRWVWYVIWNDPRLPSEVLRLRNARGTTALTMAGGIIVSHMFMAEFVFPAITSVLYNTWLAATDLLKPEGEVIYGPDEDPNWKGVYAQLKKSYQEHGGLFGKETEQTWEEILTQRLTFFTNIDNVIYKWYQLLAQEDITEKQVEEYKNELEKTMEKVGAEKDTLTSQLNNTLEKIKAEGDTLIQQGKPVQDTIVSNAEELWNKTKETVTEVIGGTDLTLEDAKAIGICENVYNKFNGKTDKNGVAYIWKKVSDTEVTCTATSTYTLFKDSGGWRWDGATNYINCQ